LYKNLETLVIASQVKLENSTANRQ